MPAPQGAPAWANELALAYESGAHGQFILYGNVHDRMAVGTRLVNLAGYLENDLLAGFRVVLAYDLGNGLTIERGGELVEKWGGADLKALPREPLPALQYISRYLRYLGNLRALGREVKENVAVILRGVDQIIPADGAGYEHGSLTSILREWSSEAPFCDLPFTSILIADNLNDVEPHGRVRRAGLAHPRAAARCGGAGARADPASRRSSRRHSLPTPICPARGGAGRRHGVRAREPGEDPRTHGAGARRGRSHSHQEGAGRARLGRARRIHRIDSARSTTITDRRRSSAGCGRTSHCGRRAI